MRYALGSLFFRQFDLVFLLSSKSIKTPNISNNVRMIQYYSVCLGWCRTENVHGWNEWNQPYLTCMAFGYQTMHFVPLGVWVHEWNGLADRIEFLFFCIVIYYVQIPRTKSHSISSTYLHLCRKMRDIQWMWSKFFLPIFPTSFIAIFVLQKKILASNYFFDIRWVWIVDVVHAYYSSHKRWEMQCDNLGVMYVQPNAFSIVYKIIAEECVRSGGFVIMYT